LTAKIKNINNFRKHRRHYLRRFRLKKYNIKRLSTLRFRGKKPFLFVTGKKYLMHNFNRLITFYRKNNRLIMYKEHKCKLPIMLLENPKKIKCKKPVIVQEKIIQQNTLIIKGKKPVIVQEKITKQMFLEKNLPAGSKLGGRIKINGHSYRKIIRSL